MWNEKQIEAHTKAAELLGFVKNEVTRLLVTGISEKEVISKIKKLYKKYGLVNDDKKEFCIVAFGESTKHVHYFPTTTSNSKLKTGNFVLLDIWARLDMKNAPYADMTWMFIKVDSRKWKVESNFKEIKDAWKVLVKSRDTAIKTIQSYLVKGKYPPGLDIDRVAHDILGNNGFGKNIKHTIGHSLGLKHPHGDEPGINWKEYSLLQKNLGYTIEPGIYLEKWGMRTEIDFYISKENKVVVTTSIQNKLDLV